ncbi:MAG: ABC transporter substrate-binding protein [Planctomycetes bacterium]|nr:ABC transporter substrate-binding protein [Planctomycetota bacterium]
MKIFCYAICFLLVAGQSVNADSKDPNYVNELLRTRAEFVVKDSKDPEVLLRRIWDATINVIKAEDIDRRTKENLIDKIINPIFDFPLMSKLALGRKNWSKLNSQQREKFIDLFVKRLRNSYRGKILLYTNQTASFKPGVHKKKTLQIPMDLVSEDHKLAMLYKLRKMSERWKIYDLEIEGVSIVLTYRSQFDDVLGRGTVEDLLSLLEKPAIPDKPSK